MLNNEAETEIVGRGRGRGTENEAKADNIVVAEPRIRGRGRGGGAGNEAESDNIVVAQPGIRGRGRGTVVQSPNSDAQADPSILELCNRAPTGILLKPPNKSNPRGRPRKGRYKCVLDVFIESFKSRRSMQGNEEA